MSMTDAELLAFRNWLAAALPGEQVQKGEMPDDPDRCVAVMDYDGPPTPNWRTEPRVQIRVRGLPLGNGISPHANAHQLADKVIAVVAPPDEENPVVDLVVNQNLTRRAILRKLSGPLPMGKDSKNRWEFSINVALDYARV